MLNQTLMQGIKTHFKDEKKINYDLDIHSILAQEIPEYSLSSEKKKSKEVGLLSKFFLINFSTLQK